MELIEKFIKNAAIDSYEFYDYIIEADDQDLTEFLKIFNSIIDESSDSSKTKSGFRFIANSTLSGFPFPCADLKCRLENLDRLARNAILYADTVFIQNPFERHSNYHSFSLKHRFTIIEDLVLLHHIRPLLKAGIFKFATSEIHFCNDCYKKFQSEYLDNFEYNLKSIEPIIAEYILRNIDFNLILRDSKRCVEVSGNNDLLEHPIIISFNRFVPKPLTRLKISQGSKKLSEEMITESGLVHWFLKDIINNISIQDFFSHYYSAHVLTNKDFDKNILELINNKNPEVENSNKKAEVLKHLNHLVPFIDKVSLKKLIELRSKEGEAFQVYRDKLSKVAKLTGEDKTIVNDYYNDEIRPELNKINLSLKNNKKLLWGNIKTNVILASTYISATLFSGILPSNLETIMASIGGFEFSKSIGKDLFKIIKKPTARDNEFYFIWKLTEDNKIKI